MSMDSSYNCGFCWKLDRDESNNKEYMLGCIGYYKINLTQSIIISLSSLVTIFSFGLRDGVGISAFLIV